MTTTTTARDEMRALLERAGTIAKRAEDAGRAFTPSERAEVKRLLDDAKRIKSNIDGAEADRELLGRMGALGPETEPMPERVVEDSFAKSVVDAGFDLKTRPTVTVPMFTALGLKASTFPSASDLIRRQPLLVPLGQDRRFLWPHLQTEDAKNATSIQDFRQGTRTVTGTVKRTLDATTDKAKVEVAITLVNEPLAQFAVTIDDIPNAVLESVPALTAFLSSEGRFQVEKAIDDHVMAQIVAATPPFGMTGTTLIEKVRNGIATMRSTGSDPNIVVVNPTDGAALDLSADAGGFVFAPRDTGTASPLWNQTVVERIGAGTEPPYLIDTRVIGVLYGGSLQFGADPFSGFKKNLTTLRVEVNALFHVRRADGARRIAAT